MHKNIWFTPKACLSFKHLLEFNDTCSVFSQQRKCLCVGISRLCVNTYFKMEHHQVQQDDTITLRLCWKSIIRGSPHTLINIPFPCTTFRALELHKFTYSEGLYMHKGRYRRRRRTRIVLYLLNKDQSSPSSSAAKSEQVPAFITSNRNILIWETNQRLGFYPIHTGRSRWSRGLRHEPSSPAQTLGSWVPIPLNAWMSVSVYSVFVLFCV
jgi:hypothetical protein